MNEMLPLFEKVVFADCWEYQGGERYAYRVVWQALVGPLPDGREIDHLCRNPRCCNPDHLRVVTHRENMLASHACKPRKLCGRRLHEMSGDNLYVSPGGARACRECRYQQRHNYYVKNGK